MPSEAGSLEISVARSGKVTSVAINVTNTSDPETRTVHTPASGHRFLIYDLFLQIETTTGDVTVMSGSNALSGPVNFSNAEDERRWNNAPLPVFKGQSKDEAFGLRLAGATGIQVNGWALIGDSNV